MDQASIRVVARVAARPGKVETLRNLLATLIEPTRGEPGCLSYELLQNPAEETDFTFVERWADQAAIDRHMQSAHVRWVLAKISELIATPPDIRCYRSIEGEPPPAGG